MSLTFLLILLSDSTFYFRIGLFGWCHIPVQEGGNLSILAFSFLAICSTSFSTVLLIFFILFHLLFSYFGYTQQSCTQYNSYCHITYKNLSTPNKIQLQIILPSNKPIILAAFLDSISSSGFIFILGWFTVPTISIKITDNANPPNSIWIWFAQPVSTHNISK